MFAKELGYEVVVVDGRASFATRGAFPAGPGRSPRRRLAGRGRRRDRARPGRRGRRPDPRRQVRRAGDRRGASARLPVRRRRRVEEDPGRPSRAAPGPRVGDDDLARLRGPVGLDLGGRNPAETALAIIAEVIAERYGGSGTPLDERARAPSFARGQSAGRRSGDGRRPSSSRPVPAPGSAGASSRALLERPAARRPRRRRRRAAGLDAIVVVVRRTDELDGLDLGARSARSSTRARRRASRARSGSACGRSSATPSVDAAVILPGDQPRVRPA